MSSQDRSSPAYSIRLAKAVSKGDLSAQSAALRKAQTGLQDLTGKRAAAEQSVKDGKLEKTDPRYVEVATAYDALAKQVKGIKDAALANKGPPPVAIPADALDLSRRVVSYEFEETEGVDQLKITLDNRDLTDFDNPVLATGNFLFVAHGYAGNMSPVREMVIRSVKGGLSLVVVAQSSAVLMNRLAKTRVFTAMTRTDIVRQIAAENGYGLDVQVIDETHAVFDHVAQAGLTDAQFLKRLATLEGYEFYIDQDGLHWHERRLGTRPRRVLQYMIPPGVADIISFDIENDLTAKPGAVALKGRDTLGKGDINAVANGENTPRTTLAATSIVIDPQTSEQTRRTADASADVKPTSANNADEAKKEAAGIFKKTQLTAVLLSATMVGDPSMRAKQVVEVRGLGKRVSGKYYLKTVSHKIDSSGYQVSFKARTDGDNKATGKPKPDSGANQNTQSAQPPGTVQELDIAGADGTQTRRWSKP